MLSWAKIRSCENLSEDLSARCRQSQNNLITSGWLMLWRVDWRLWLKLIHNKSISIAIDLVTMSPWTRLYVSQQKLLPCKHNSEWNKLFSGRSFVCCMLVESYWLNWNQLSNYLLTFFAKIKLVRNHIKSEMGKTASDSLTNCNS